MCGIAGIIFNASSLAKDAFEHQLLKMTGSIAHRGPDGEKIWINKDGNVGFGHRRLSIIDLSESASQPMHFNDLTIIHNGEIYNYIELREELRKIGYSFQTQSDTEVILAAYDHWQSECVEYFDGMFAFAIWDQKKKELFAARDRFGEKPFFYCLDNEKLLFASEMKALWAAGKERRINQRLLFNFISIGYTDNPEQPSETFFEGISKLPPATILKYKPATGEIILENYWDIDPEEQNNNITDPEAIEKFNALFTSSIKRRLRSDVSIGTSLSGGLDSSSIVAALSGISSQNTPLNVFTAAFPGFEKDESAFAKKAADQFGLKQYTTDIRVENFISDWTKLVYHQEEPFSSASNYAQWSVFALAKQKDVKVLLDGQGADETLAGYHKYYKWFWQELFHKRKLMRSRELKAAKDKGVNERFGMRNIIASIFPDIASVILERQYLLKALHHRDFSRDFVRMQSKEAYYSTPAHFNLNGVLYFNTCIHGLEELLRYADRNSMAHGREVRLPFLDHQLVEFIFSLPSHFKIRDGWTKWLLRENFKDRLPAEISWRKEKVGFEPPQESWMKHPAMMEMIIEARRKLVNEKILDPRALATPVQPKGSHEADNYDWRYLVSAAYL